MPLSVAKARCVPMANEWANDQEGQIRCSNLAFYLL